LTKVYVDGSLIVSSVECGNHCMQFNTFYIVTILTKVYIDGSLIVSSVECGNHCMKFNTFYIVRTQWNAVPVSA